MADKTMMERLSAWIGSDVQRPNWDSYGAAPIETRTIIVAMKIAERLEGLAFDGRKMDFVGPCVNGEIEFSDGDESVYLRLTTIRPDESAI